MPQYNLKPLDVQILLILAKRGSYAYRIRIRLEGKGFPIAISSLYYRLHDLETRGILKNYSITQYRNPPRRMYRLTYFGRKRLGQLVLQLSKEQIMLNEPLFELLSMVFKSGPIAGILSRKLL